MSRIIDLSTTFYDHDKGQLESPHIKYFNHKKGGLLLGIVGCILIDKSIFKIIKNLFLYTLSLRKITYKDFPHGFGLAWEKINISTHCGTHLDAPYHYGPTCNGASALTIDKIPLEYCFSDGVILDFRDKKAGGIITVDDLKIKLNDIKYKLKPKDIVLIMTGRDKLIHKKEYPFSHPGLSRGSISWLVNNGIKIIGIDAWSIDRPINFMVRDYLKYKDNSYLWPAHLVGRNKEIFHIEQLVNLEALPRFYNFKIVCFPIKVKDASAGWCRVVAIVKE